MPSLSIVLVELCSVIVHNLNEGVKCKEYLTYLKTLENKIKTAIVDYGVTCFISGMALGVDLDFAEIVLNLRKTFLITLECAIPCPNQTYRWSVRDIKRYKQIIKRADKVTLLSERYTPDCMLKRNRYMIDKSALAIAVFNGIKQGGTWYTIRYAKAKGVRVMTINLNEM